jgi:thioredoxin 1
MGLDAWIRPSGGRDQGSDQEGLSLDALGEGEYPNGPVKLTDADLDQSVRRFPLVVVDCWAPWCGPCHMVAPVIAELARDYMGKIVFGKLNVDESPTTAMKYGIQSIPAMLVFQRGEMVDLIIGAQPREMLEPQVKRYLPLEEGV